MMDARVTKMTQRYAFRLLFQSDQKYAITMQLDGFTAKHSEDASANRQLLYYRIKKLKDYYLNIFLLRYPYRIYEIAFFMEITNLRFHGVLHRLFNIRYFERYNDIVESRDNEIEIEEFRIWR